MDGYGTLPEDMPAQSGMAAPNLVPPAPFFESLVHSDLPALDPDSPTPPRMPSFRTPFGGLWTDLNTANAVLAGKVALGELSQEEGQLLAAWLRDGFVILRGAVDPDAIDIALLDFENAFRGKLRRKVSYWGEDGPRIEDAHPSLIGRTEAKLLDIHDISLPMQALQFAPPISRFLRILFRRPALAFQSLSFYHGSQQPIHQDTAFVRVSSPMEFVASWIALEDIDPGAGELEYYPGSHLLLPYLFQGAHLWARSADEAELENYSSALHARAEGAGLQRQRFSARKGDVLIWAAGLMHGGSPVENPAATRRSLVTHYCPADQQPMYFHGGDNSKRPSFEGHYATAQY